MKTMNLSVREDVLMALANATRNRILTTVVHGTSTVRATTLPVSFMRNAKPAAIVNHEKSVENHVFVMNMMVGDSGTTVSVPNAKMDNVGRDVTGTTPGLTAHVL